MSSGESVLGDGLLINAVSDHLKKYFGTIDFVIHEKSSHDVHVDIHVVAPSRSRNFYTLITSGMAQGRMSVPKGADEFCELILCLPPQWKIQQQFWEDPANYWPISVLHHIAHFPYANSTWIGPGHSIQGEASGDPFAPGTLMSDILVLESKTIAEEAEFIYVGGREIRLLGVYPIYRQELDYKIAHGSAALDVLFDRAGVTELLTPMRRSVIVPT